MTEAGFCSRCGSALAGGARFCSACGAPALTATVAGAAYAPTWTGAPVTAGPAMTRLQRPRAQRMVAGVCAGLALQYGWDLTWVRVLTVLITIFSSGAGLIAYIVFWLVMPEQPWMLPAPVGVGTVSGTQAGVPVASQVPPAG